MLKYKHCLSTWWRRAEDPAHLEWYVMMLLIAVIGCCFFTCWAYNTEYFVRAQFSLCVMVYCMVINYAVQSRVGTGTGNQCWVLCPIHKMWWWKLPARLTANTSIAKNLSQISRQQHKTLATNFTGTWMLGEIVKEENRSQMFWASFDTIPTLKVLRKPVEKFAIILGNSRTGDGWMASETWRHHAYWSETGSIS